MHYVEHQTLCDEHQEEIDKSRRRGIIFNHVHSIGYESDKPLVSMLTFEIPDQCAGYYSPPLIQPSDDPKDMYMCVFCDIYGSFDQQGILDHVRDV